MTRSMPHRKLAGLLAVVATVGACAGAGLAETRSGAPPSGFRVQPNVVDPLCNGGRGERIAAPHAAFPTLAVASMPHGSTLTALSSGDPDTRTAVLVSVTSRCQPNAAFGRGGVATIAF